MRRTEAGGLPRSGAAGIPAVGIIGAEAMLGSPVVDRDGNPIGELRDLILDLRLGRVAYGVVALAYGPASRGRLKAVPWNVMHVDYQSNLRVNAQREWVAGAPSLEAGLVPSLLDHEWAEFIHSYFGARPYWERNAQHA